LPHNHGDSPVIVDMDIDRATGAGGLDLCGM
jgi:hypothetical protein